MKLSFEFEFNGFNSTIVWRSLQSYRRYDCTMHWPCYQRKQVICVFVCLPFIIFMIYYWPRNDVEMDEGVPTDTADVYSEHLSHSVFRSGRLCVRTLKPN